MRIIECDTSCKPQLIGPSTAYSRQPLPRFYSKKQHHYYHYLLRASSIRFQPRSQGRTPCPSTGTTPPPSSSRLAFASFPLPAVFCLSPPASCRFLLVSVAPSPFSSSLISTSPTPSPLSDHHLHWYGIGIKAIAHISSSQRLSLIAPLILQDTTPNPAVSTLRRLG